MGLLRPGANVWRIERAHRFALFRDVAGCFAAMRNAMLQAEHSITIVGWDIDSRTRLVGCGGEATDGHPAELRPFLAALSRAKPHLQINLLLWDFASIYSFEREALPRFKLAWDGANLVLDSCLPTGSSQHQKLVVIDGSLAFCGGLDVTIRRWDTAAHAFGDPHRVDPNGKPYNPFHDVQAVVDGPAAAALASLVSERWRCASGEDLPPTAAANLWPSELAPDFKEMDVGISRTVPVQDGIAEAREAEQLFFDMINAAERTLYIENQFLTSAAVAECIAQRLLARPDLEALIIAPKTHHSWLEAVAMRHGRLRFAAIVRAAGAPDRVRFAYPEVSKGRRHVDVMVHSKVMVVDDRLLRVGSANLNNRSMGADSECDLVIEDTVGDQRERMAAARDRLLAMHCGVGDAEMAQATQSLGLVEASRRLRGRHHRLVDIDDEAAGKTDYPLVLDAIADPERPIDADTFLALMTGDEPRQARISAAMRLTLVGCLLLGLAAFWAVYAGEAEATVNALLDLRPDSWQTAVAVAAIFVVGSALMVPVTLLIVGTSATLGLSWGLPYAALGTLLAAGVSYGLGAWLGTDIVRRAMGGRLAKLRNAIQRRGILAIALIRMVPIAPFTLINLGAGATAIGFWRFLAGTVIGMAPGFVLLSALGSQLYQLLSQPTFAGLLIFSALVLLWIAALLLAQHWARRQAFAG